MSLGDSRSYLLSTARNDCGVVYAKSTSGELLRHRVKISCLSFPLVFCNSGKQQLPALQLMRTLQ